MSDDKIIDLNERRNARGAPEAGCVFVDVEDGRPVKYFKFFGEYDFDGKQWIVNIWATDQDQAQQKMAALGNVRYMGQIFGEQPA